MVVDLFLASCPETRCKYWPSRLVAYLEWVAETIGELAEGERKVECMRKLKSRAHVRQEGVGVSQGTGMGRRC